MDAFGGFELVRLGYFANQGQVIGEVLARSSDKMEESWWETLNKALPISMSMCESLGLIVTAAAIERLQARVHDGEKDLAVIGDDLGYIGKQLRKELDAKKFLHVPPEAAKLLDEWRDGWDMTLEKFPSASLDVEEAGKSLALERFTASVFHSMRILECGLTALANHFSVSTARANWHEALKDIETAISLRSRNEGAGWAEQSFYSEAALQMRFFKDAWRNHVMHVRQTFDEKRAVNIYKAVQAFMSLLAEKLEEQPS